MDLLNLAGNTRHRGTRGEVQTRRYTPCPRGRQEVATSPSDRREGSSQGPLQNTKCFDVHCCKSQRGIRAGWCHHRRNSDRGRSLQFVRELHSRNPQGRELRKMNRRGNTSRKRRVLSPFHRPHHSTSQRDTTPHRLLRFLRISLLALSHTSSFRRCLHRYLPHRVTRYETLGPPQNVRSRQGCTMLNLTLVHKTLGRSWSATDDPHW